MQPGWVTMCLDRKTNPSFRLTKGLACGINWSQIADPLMPETGDMLPRRRDSPTGKGTVNREDSAPSKLRSCVMESCGP
jgi:hypothetical protein